MQHAVPAAHRVADRGWRAFLATIALLTGLAWAATILVARSPVAMSAMPGQATPLAAALFAGMWLVMMAAMMLPAITPVVLLFRNVQRQRGASGRPAVPTAIFVAGYLAVWLLAGLAADLVYTLAQAVGARIPTGTNAVPYVGGAIVILAGIYQFTPLKNACLRHCRSPLHLVMHGWREGYGGATRMGATHGLFCLGCCGGIMAVLFVVGLMNLGWMAALSLLILTEKLAPRGVAIGRLVGGLFIVLGLLMALQPRLFPAGGLTTTGGGMAMTSMSAAPAIGPITYRVPDGPYALTLAIGPAEQMLTPAEAHRTHPHAGEVILDGAMPDTMPMGAMQRHLELRALDRAMGMAVTNAHVTVSVQGSGAPMGTLTLMRMYGVKEGMKDLHYGLNVSLPKGVYLVRVRVNGHGAAVRVRAS